MSVTVLAPETMKDAAKELIQGIQSGIGTVSKVGNHDTEFSLKLETAAESEVKTKAASGDYDIVLYPLVSNSASPITFLNDIDSLKITDFTKTILKKHLKKQTQPIRLLLFPPVKNARLHFMTPIALYPFFTNRIIMRRQRSKRSSISSRFGEGFLYKCNKIITKEARRQR